MNVDVKELWITALRSGDYKQDSTSYKLQSNNGFCCLGVLCDIAVKQGVIPEPKIINDNSRLFGIEVPHELNSSNFSYLPDAVMQWSGIKDAMGSIKNSYPNVYNSRRSSELSTLNDGGVSFSVLADIIDKEL